MAGYNLWYRIIRVYTKVGLFFYYRSVKVYGRENIPEDKPVLFIANHRNGLIDPILIATTADNIQHFLTRASAFKHPVANMLLRSINMMPIYRIRDGIGTLTNNQEIFKNCYAVFDNQEAVVMFPEASHELPRRLRPLRKGFARISFEYTALNPDNDLFILPVGINYENALKPWTKVAVYYGKPIKVTDYYNSKDINTAYKTLLKKATEELKTLSVHIADKERITAIENQLKAEGYDFTNPVQVNERIKTIQSNPPETTSSPVSVRNNLLMRLLYLIFMVNAVLPLLIWRSIKKRVKDPIILNTFRFGLGLGLFTFFYLLQTTLIVVFAGFKIGIAYLVLTLLVNALVVKNYIL
ncbi:MAG: acyltransferase [Flavobacteriia bacterium]|nr:MAG: acyltransferase [Flavobacteriia bacterium]